jgi:Mn2+/Fe2+ NRAMP family transporter
LRLINREDLMGDYRNNRTFNIIAWATCIAMIVLTLALVVSTFFPTKFNV